MATQPHQAPGVWGRTTHKQLVHGDVHLGATEDTQGVQARYTWMVHPNSAHQSNFSAPPAFYGFLSMTEDNDCFVVAGMG